MYHQWFLTLLFLFFFFSKQSLELLIVGCGRYNHPLNPQVRQFVKSIGMKLETVDSVCPLFYSSFVLLVWSIFLCLLINALIYPEKCCINLQHTQWGRQDRGCCIASLWSYIVRNSTPLEYCRTNFEQLDSIFIVETPTWSSCLL